MITLDTSEKIGWQESTLMSSIAIKNFDKSKNPLSTPQKAFNYYLEVHGSDPTKIAETIQIYMSRKGKDVCVVAGTWQDKPIIGLLAPDDQLFNLGTILREHLQPINEILTSSHLPNIKDLPITRIQ